MARTLLEQISLRAETDFCDSVLKHVHSFSETDLELWCSDFDHDRHVLKVFYIISCLETILIYNTLFDRLHDDLKLVLLVLGKEILISDLNKYMSCTYDPGILMFVLSSQDKQFQTQRSERINRAYQPKIWRWKYLRKTTSKLQGSFYPKFFFIEFYMILKFFLSDSFSFDSGKMDLRTNPFEEGEYDVPRFQHRPAWIMDTVQGGDLVDQLDLTEVFSSDHANFLIIYATLDELRSAVDTEDKLKPAEESVHEPKPAEVRVDELSELSDTTLELDELSDTTLELSELSDTEDGAGLAAGRNEPFQPKEKFIKSSLWVCFFPNSTSPFLSPFQAHSHQEYQEGVNK